MFAVKSVQFLLSVLCRSVLRGEVSHVFAVFAPSVSADAGDRRETEAAATQTAATATEAHQVKQTNIPATTRKHLLTAEITSLSRTVTTVQMWTDAGNKSQVSLVVQL